MRSLPFPAHLLPDTSSLISSSHPRRTRTPGQQTDLAPPTNSIYPDSFPPESITTEDLTDAQECDTGGRGNSFNGLILNHRVAGKLALKRLRVLSRQEYIEMNLQLKLTTGELESWKAVRHPNILPFMGVVRSSNDLYFVWPYVKNGSLRSCIHQHSYIDLLRLLQETAAAITYLHRCGIVHGNVNLSNILISDEAHALLCDFELPMSLQTGKPAELQGSEGYRWKSPEILIGGGNISFEGDVWAFGMVMYAVLSGRTPFDNCVTKEDVIHAMLNDEIPSRQPIDSRDASPQWKVAEGCWRKDPARRLSMEEVHDCLQPSELNGQPLALCTDTRTIATKSWNNKFRLSNTSSGMSTTFKGHTNAVTAIAVAPDGRTIGSASLDHTIRLWDAGSGEKKSTPLIGHSSGVLCLAFSPDGETMASGGFDRTVRIWAKHSGYRMTQVLAGHTDTVWCITYAPDSKTIASGSADGTIRLWHSECGAKWQASRVLKGHTDWVRCLAFCIDGRNVVSGSYDRGIRVWDVKSGKQKGATMNGHLLPVRCLAVSPDGRTIASGSYDRTVRLWGVDSGVQVGETLLGHGDTVECVVFSSSSRTLLTASLDQQFRSWPVDTI